MVLEDNEAFGQLRASVDRRRRHALSVDSLHRHPNLAIVGISTLLDTLSTRGIEKLRPPRWEAKRFKPSKILEGKLVRSGEKIRPTRAQEMA
jgi:hypothetical protein